MREVILHLFLCAQLRQNENQDSMRFFIKTLMQNNADVNKAALDESTPLHIIADKQLVPLMQELLKSHDLNLDKQNAQHETAMDIAEKRKNLTIKLLLSSYVPAIIVEDKSDEEITPRSQQLVPPIRKLSTPRTSLQGTAGPNSPRKNKLDYFVAQNT